LNAAADPVGTSPKRRNQSDFCLRGHRVVQFLIGFRRL
jgi:hypothetical protein